MLEHCFLKYKLTSDMKFYYGTQQLLWQKQVILIGSIDVDSQISEYHTAVAQFQHAVCNRRSVRRQRFAPTSLFFVVADAYSWSFNRETARMPNGRNAEWAECRKEVRAEIKQKFQSLLLFVISELPTVPGRIAHCRRKSRNQRRKNPCGDINQRAGRRWVENC